MSIGSRYRERLNDSGSAIIKLGELNSYHGLENPYGQSFYGKSNWVEPQVITTGSPIPYDSNYSWCWDQVNPGPPYRTGGALTLVKTLIPSSFIQGTGVYESSHNAASYFRYTGGWAAPDFFGDVYTHGDYADLGNNLGGHAMFPDLDTLGSGAYKKLRPKIAEAGVGVAVGEIRQLPMMLAGTAKTFHEAWREMGGLKSSWSQAPKKASDNFLNVQFGWTPFLKDLSDLHRIATNAEKYMAQLKRDNNTWVKRNRSDKVIESEDIVTRWQPICCQPTAGYPISEIFSPTGQTYAYIVLRNTTHVWYEGVFKYYRPEFDDSNSRSKGLLGTVDRNITLYGARINPSMIWKVTPWTWLADWFGNVGDVIERANDWAMDGVVSKYMYLMHRTVHSCVLRQHLGLRSGPISFDFERKAEIKRRQGAASPFDFSLKDTDLSARQLAILGAIGITGSRPGGNRPG